MPPEVLDEVPFLNFAPLQNAITRLEASAAAYDASYDAMRAPHTRLRVREGTNRASAPGPATGT